jgi:DNA-binding CsgD family transcriptional regulator
MNAFKLSRATAIGVITVAFLNTMSSLSVPRPDMKPDVWRVVLWLALLLTHAAVYWFADRLYRRLGARGFVGIQAAIVFAIGMTGALFPVGAGLYAALTVFAVIVEGSRWGSVQITFAAIAVFAVNAILTSNIYRGATIGLLLAVAGVVGHAIAALFKREDRPEAASMPPTQTESRANGGPTGRSELTPRENEVLAALARGARNRDIANQLGIAERTVKVHLASIYMKLGVESRTAAVALAARDRRD